MTPIVSVYCLAYNHEKYIRNALDGFISQKTSFPYEVFVHDDASTDNTAEIIREYAEKYPDIIKPIFQTENQYSRCIPIYKTFIFPRIKSKYIAVCEGDDYWCDENKLQMQVDWLENHPDYSCCVHNTRVIDCSGGKERLINSSLEDKDISTTEIIQWKEGLFHTSSCMYRYEYGVTPSIFSVKGVGDYPRAVYLATCGKIRYLSKVMSVYRFLTEESWSLKMYKSTNANEKSIGHYQERIEMLKRVNEYTNGKYIECIHEVIKRNEYNILYAQNDLKTIKKDYKKYYAQLALKDKLYANIRFYSPFLLKIYHKIYIHK